MNKNADITLFCSVFATGKVAGPPKFIKQSVSLDIEVSSPLDPYQSKWILTLWLTIPKFEPVENDIIAIQGSLVVKYYNEKIYLNVYDASINSIIKESKNNINIIQSQIESNQEQEESHNKINNDSKTTENITKTTKDLSPKNKTSIVYKTELIEKFKNKNGGSDEKSNK